MPVPVVNSANVVFDIDMINGSDADPRSVTNPGNYVLTNMDTGQATKIGAVFYDARDYDAAIAEATEVIRLKPNNAFGYGTRGAAHAPFLSNPAATACRARSAARSVLQRSDTRSTGIYVRDTFGDQESSARQAPARARRE